MLAFLGCHTEIDKRRVVSADGAHPAAILVRASVCTVIRRSSTPHLSAQRWRRLVESMPLIVLVPKGIDVDKEIRASRVAINARAESRRVLWICAH